MHLKYLGGKTDHSKYVHVYYLTEHDNMSAYLPPERMLDTWLKSDTGLYSIPGDMGKFIIQIIPV